MMRYKIFHEFYGNGGYIKEYIIEAETLKQLQDIAKKHLEKHKPDHYWSEKLEG